MTVDRETIESLVPHAGRMCLIEVVDDWDTHAFRGRAHTGEPSTHPLGGPAGLPATALAEYGAQAMAVHGGLLAGAGTPPRPGLLVSLRNLELAVACLTGPTELTVTARRAGGDAGGASYNFEIQSEGRVLASGSAMVMFPDTEDLT